MKQFTFVVTDPVGIHARPAGMLAKFAKAMDSTVTVTRTDDGRSAEARKLMALMGLGIKAGETVAVAVEGGDEDANAAAMEQFCRENL